MLVIQSCGFWAASKPLEHVAAPIAIGAAVAGGIMSALTQGAPTTLSEAYFSAGSSGRSTALAYSSNYLGICGGFLAFSAMSSFQDLVRFLWITMLMSFGLFVACITAPPPKVNENVTIS